MNDWPLTRRTLLTSTLAAVCFLLALPARSQSPQTPPAQLVRAAIQNELTDDANVHLFAWKTSTDRGHKTQMERDVQTPDGVVSRVILINGKPLNPAQQSEENARVREMLAPEQMKRKLKDQQEDDARTRKMLEAIPDAFDFVHLDSIMAPNGHKLTTFKFTPRPGYNPPSREVAVFTGMQGELVVDETARRLAKVDGTLFKEVNFGWGILGRLYKGGRFLVEKSEVTPTHWDTTHSMIHFEGKVLVFKSLHIDENETDWDFKPVPPMSVGQALDYLNHSDTPQDASSPTSSGSSLASPSTARSDPAVSHTRVLALDSSQSSPRRRP
jgi:hypothetical protein